MKKFFLAAFIITVFAIYAVNQRQGGVAASTSTTNSLINNNSSGSAAGSVASLPAYSGVTSSSGSNSSIVQSTTGLTYKNGNYTGVVADAYYGNVQVKAVVSGGKITDVVFLDHPQDRSTSREINNQAMPRLISQAIQAQSAQVDGVSGATATSDAFRQSLQSALKLAS